MKTFESDLNFKPALIYAPEKSSMCVLLQVMFGVIIKTSQSANEKKYQVVINLMYCKWRGVNFSGDMEKDCGFGAPALL